MSAVDFEILAVATLTAAACALPGVFLVLRRMALMSDAISHTVLLGIVLGFLAVGHLSSPLLVVAAAATGVLTVALVEAVRNTGLVREDASIGLVFPALFSVAVILIARFADRVHLDSDVVLLGELALAPFRRLEVSGVDLGPRSAWVMGIILVGNLCAILAFYKELKLSTFDPALAEALGFSPRLMHYGFMSMVSVTAVGAFDAVGSILVVGLMIAPPAAAYLLTDRLAVMLVTAVLIGAASSVGGYGAARAVDGSISGAMTVVACGAFGAALVLAPGRGLASAWRRRRRQRITFAQQMLAIHLANHENSSEADVENHERHLGEHLRWSEPFSRRVVERCRREGTLRRREDGLLELTDSGRSVARRAGGLRVGA